VCWWGVGGCPPVRGGLPAPPPPPLPYLPSLPLLSPLPTRVAPSPSPPKSPSSSQRSGRGSRTVWLQTQASPRRTRTGLLWGTFCPSCRVCGVLEFMPRDHHPWATPPPALRERSEHVAKGPRPPPAVNTCVLNRVGGRLQRLRPCLPGPHAPTSHHVFPRQRAECVPSTPSSACQQPPFPPPSLPTVRSDHPLLGMRAHC
jgi:hypothetical protein